MLRYTHWQQCVALWLRSSVRQNVGLQNQMSEVQILSGSPSIWGIGIIGNTVALQASVSGSIPLSSTKVSISIRKVRSYNGIRADC